MTSRDVMYDEQRHHPRSTMEIIPPQIKDKDIAGGGHVTSTDVMWSQVPHWWWCSRIDITNEYNEYRHRDNIDVDKDI